MKTVFDEQTRKELIERIHSLDERNMAQWGKMNLYQMLMHCTIWEEWIQGKKPCTYKQDFIGKLFGRLTLKSVMKDDEPLRRNTPTGSAFLTKEKTGDITSLKIKWAGYIEGYAMYSNPAFIHDFFGKMTEEQIGILAYKHSDHHLRQFKS